MMFCELPQVTSPELCNHLTIPIVDQHSNSKRRSAEATGTVNVDKKGENEAEVEVDGKVWKSSSYLTSLRPDQVA
jgi:hypothetical protein